MGRDQGQPSILKLEIGHKNGVGKNLYECVKMSKIICKGQARDSLSSFRKTNQYAPKNKRKTIKLWLMSYKVVI